MMMPKMAKKAMTIRNDMLVRSRDPHVPFLLRFFAPPEDLVFFEDSFEYIFFPTVTCRVANRWLNATYT